MVSGVPLYPRQRRPRFSVPFAYSTLRSMCSFCWKRTGLGEVRGSRAALKILNDDMAFIGRSLFCERKEASELSGTCFREQLPELRFQIGQDLGRPSRDWLDVNVNVGAELTRALSMISGKSTVPSPRGTHWTATPRLCSYTTESRRWSVTT